MKKKLLGIMAVTAVVIVAGYNIYVSQNNVNLSELALSNIEALAESKEGGTTIECCAALWGVCQGQIKAPYVKCTFN